MVLNVIIAEAALELIPIQVLDHPSVRNEARRRGVEPRDMLLDRSIHHAAMLKLEEHFKRGRPDLVYLTLLNATSTPLYQDGKAKVYIHTRDDIVLDFAERTRPPKSYTRFRDLMQQALFEKPDSGLIRVYDSTVKQILQRTGSGPKIGLSVQGGRMRLDELATRLGDSKESGVVIGGFPRGHFEPETTEGLERLVRIDERSLDAHVVVARLIYEVEKLVRGVG
jgi:rRNA small subunit pseudouridine methyltransferase Nep1